MNVFEYIKTLDIKELNQFLYAVYMSGNKDGINGLEDDESGWAYRIGMYEAKEACQALEESSHGVAVYETYKMKEKNNDKETLG